MCAAACVLLALLSTSESHAIEFITCPKIVPFFTHVHAYRGKRVIEIFTKVAQIADLKGRRFALCESKEFSPFTYTIPGKSNLDFAIIIPAAITEFPEPVIKGIFAHELGHTQPLDFNNIDALELQADERAVAWVGKDAVIESLRAMSKNIHRFPRWQQDVGRVVLETRIKALGDVREAH
jgi:hypothetical protein